MNDRLVFVYNADSGLANTVLDHLHKVLSPSTYACNLCRLAYPGFAAAPEWKAFLASLPLEAEFHHRDTFGETYGARSEPLPAVYRLSGGALSVVADGRELSALETLPELVALLRGRI
jgi:hypothetical protein